MLQPRVEQRIQLGLAARRLSNDESINDGLPDDVGSDQRTVRGDANSRASVLAVIVVREECRRISIDERTHIS